MEWVGFWEIRRSYVFFFTELGFMLILLGGRFVFYCVGGLFM